MLTFILTMPGNVTEQLLRKILAKHDLGEAFGILASKLKRDELVTVLMALHESNAAGQTPAGILHQLLHDRFAIPGSVPQRVINEFDSEAMSLIPEYHSLELSPVAPAGICSTVAPVSPKWSIGTARMQEVLSDCANVLAAIGAIRRKDLMRCGGGDTVVRLCTSHRLIRPQKYDHPLFSAHFRVFCLVTAGRDRGNFLFEQTALAEHLRFYSGLIQKFDATRSLPVELRVLLTEQISTGWLEGLLTSQPDLVRTNITTRSDPGFSYYDPVQFKMRLIDGDDELDLIDGGFVDWSQQFLSDRKERMLISAIGTEIFCKKYLAVEK